MEGWATAWWFWVLLGFLLLFLELVTPTGFFLLFFGVAAVLVGLLPPWVWPGLPGCNGCSFPCFRSAVCCCCGVACRKG